MASDRIWLLYKFHISVKGIHFLGGFYILEDGRPISRHKQSGNPLLRGVMASPGTS